MKCKTILKIKTGILKKLVNQQNLNELGQGHVTAF